MRKLLFLLAAIAFAVPALADNINLVPPGSYYNYVYSYTFPAGSSYNQYYGTGLGLIETGTYGYASNGSYVENEVEVWNGTTTGALTKFASSYVYLYNWGGSTYNYIYGGLTNAVFNSTTDVLTGQFSGYDYKSNGQYVAMSGLFTENLNLNGGSWNYGDYTFTEGSVVSGSLATPEPSSLLMFGTGLIGVASVIRRKLRA